jgi:biopolymer transport protein TolR
MITAPMLTQGVNVELPKASAEPVDDKDNEPVIVTVNAQGDYFIDVGGDPKEAVSAEIVQERISKILASNPSKMLLVRGDRNVNYDKVVQLMVLLQQAGAPSVGLVTE